MTSKLLFLVKKTGSKKKEIADTVVFHDISEMTIQMGSRALQQTSSIVLPARLHNITFLEAHNCI